MAKSQLKNMLGLQAKTASPTQGLKEYNKKKPAFETLNFILMRPYCQNIAKFSET